jgi:serine/threonine-protein kinase
MAVVHKAQDLSLGRLVAVKILRETLTSDPEFLARFQQEARAAANLAHPNIVTVHDFGRDGGRYYIVMEFIEGQDLKTIIKEAAPFTVDYALDLAIQVCAGVGYAHRAGLVHCDIKPQNILVTGDGRVKITDFGIARALANIRPGETTDVVWGSPQYYSPEQAAGEHPTPGSDVYSIGVVMFEMLAGRLPFVASTQQALALMHLREEPPRLSLFNDQVPETLERIVHKVLAKEPAARYRTADQLGRILISFRQQGAALVLGSGNTPAEPQPRAAIPAASAPTAAPTTAAPTRRADSNAPTYAPTPVVSAGPVTETVNESEEGLDWIAVGLGFLAVLAVVGLIPLYVWIYLVYTR